MESLLRRAVWLVVEHPRELALTTLALALAAAAVFGGAGHHGGGGGGPLAASSSASVASAGLAVRPAAGAADADAGRLAAAVSRAWPAHAPELTRLSARPPRALAPAAPGRLRFLVSDVDARADAAKPHGAGAGGTGDVFLSVPRRLVLAPLNGGSHILVFNKFYVRDRHVVAFASDARAPQEGRLSRADFSVMLRLAIALDGLAFFNGGDLAGASQPRRHIQALPGDGLTSLAAAGLGAAAAAGGDAPLDAVVTAYRAARGWAGPEPLEPVTLPALPFAHALWLLGAADVGRAFHGGGADGGGGGGAAYAVYAAHAHADGPHNLLVTPRYVLLVPRSAEHGLPGRRLSINALGFAGLLLAKGAEAQAALVRAEDAEAALVHAGRAA